MLTLVHLMARNLNAMHIYDPHLCIVAIRALYPNLTGNSFAIVIRLIGSIELLSLPIF